jgi:glucose/arabinose dehydrogenase
MRHMKVLVSISLVLGIGVGTFFFVRERTPAPVPVLETGTNEEIPPQDVEIIAEGLEIPWDIAFLPGGGMLVTERTGHVIHISTRGTHTEIKVEGSTQGGEGGLLGITLHPNFSENSYVYLYMSSPGAQGETENRVVRYQYANGDLTEDRSIISKIPGALYHDGGRMEWGPDHLLYITTGDATRSQIAQDKNSLGGKILRIHDDGTIPADNPFGSAVYSFGHRNPQGLAWDAQGRLWESEHGRSGILSGLDEINLIEKGQNYGWPAIEGDETKAGMRSPAAHSGKDDTWAPASLAYVEGRLFFGGLRGEALYEAVLDGERVTEVKEHFKNEFGRIRTVRAAPDGMLYLTTSNRDGRGTPVRGDDKIIRINPSAL